MNENLKPELPVDDNIENEAIGDMNNTTVEEITKEQATSVESINQVVEETEVASTGLEVKTLTKDEILEKLKNISMLPEMPHRSETESLKQMFYKLKSAELENEKTEYVEAGNDPETFSPNPDPSEEVLKTFLNEIKDKRAKQVAEVENVKENNYKRKLSIIENIKALTESTDDFNKLYKEFKDMQKAWGESNPVPSSKERELWTSYQIHSEMFYDLIKINNEFRDYDFKKNLELKKQICEASEKLISEADSVSAFHQLQNFHKQWREIGPVAKEFREELWEKFKAASTEINKKYQTHFESLKGLEEENLQSKTAICEKLEAIDYSVLDSFKTWSDKSKEVIDLQAEWKTIGFVPRKVNTQIFERFRELCDDFFRKKSEFFKDVKKDMNENLQRKRELCDRAIELKDSNDWKSTTEELIAIQKEWKKVGPVPRKYSDAIWKEFVGACDYFFDEKKKNDSNAKEEEVENLSLKNAIVENIRNIDIEQEASQVIAQVRAFADEWNTIGFVPFKEKDKIYKEFHKAVDSHYDRLKIDKTERRMEAFRSNIQDAMKTNNASRFLLKERDNLLYKYNKMKSDLQTYENNMSFLSISSKGANALLKDVHNKIEALKTEMELLAQKVGEIDAKLEEAE